MSNKVLPAPGAPSLRWELFHLGWTWETDHSLDLIKLTHINGTTHTISRYDVENSATTADLFAAIQREMQPEVKEAPLPPHWTGNRKLDVT